MCIEFGGQLEQFLYFLIITFCWWLIVNKVVCSENVNVVSVKGLEGAFVYVYLEILRAGCGPAGFIIPIIYWSSQTIMFTCERDPNVTVTIGRDSYWLLFLSQVTVQHLHVSR